MFYKRSRSLYFKFYSLYRVSGKLHALAIGRRHSTRRQRIAPFDLRRASLPVSTALVDIRLVTINRHARCFL